MDVKPVAVNGAMGHLIEAGLIFTEEMDVNGEGKCFTFIYAYEHGDGGNGNLIV